MGSLEQRFPRYARLLKLYPSGYRARYGGQMLQTLADMLDDPERTPATIWMRAALDFPYSVIRQQLSYSGEVMVNTMPSYIKGNALLGALLVAPFFIFILLNDLTHQSLRQTWVWHSGTLFIWLIALPGLATIFNLAALLRWAVQRRRETHAGAWKIMTDFRLNWPALGVMLVGLAILALVFGHDSVHCISGNPIRELHNPHQTLQCIERG